MEGPKNSIKLQIAGIMSVDTRAFVQNCPPLELRSFEIVPENNVPVPVKDGSMQVIEAELTCLESSPWQDKAKKSISFSDKARIHLIPTRKELKTFVSDVYYNHNDFDFFMYEARAEIFRVMKMRSITQREAKRLLYQSNYPIEELIKGNQWDTRGLRQHLLVLVSIITYFAITFAVKYCKLF